MIAAKNYIKLCDYQKKELLLQINKYCRNTDHAFTSANVTEYVNKELGESLPVQFVSKFIKEETNLTFKKVKQRPSNVDFTKLKQSRRLFGVKIGKILSSETLVVNIDESSINRHIKISYSWSFKGLPKEVKSSPFSGSVSIVLAICSNGDWISLFTNTTIKSNKFIQFIDVIEQWMQKHSYFGYSKIVYLLDNWPFYKSKHTFSKLKRLNGAIMFLPAYSPDYAPVEVWFAIIKNFPRLQCSKKNIKLNLKHSYQLIKEALSTLRKKTIRGLFGKAYRKIKDDLNL